MLTTNKAFDEMIRRKGYSYDEVALKMGISRQRLFQLRQEPYMMSLVQVERVAEIAGVPFEEVHKIHRDSRGKK